MENLRAYKENVYNDNYIVIVNKTRFERSKTFVTRKAAENYNSHAWDGLGDVLTFREAAKKYPEYFSFK